MVDGVPGHLVGEDDVLLDVEEEPELSSEPEHAQTLVPATVVDIVLDHLYSDVARNVTPRDVQVAYCN